ncbi:MAG: hypothetical protein DRN53_02795 [Thermoprotei archaeon]|nr:MAG: hypothetical protein DRN53_02795 [Thermoprotei archaeon]
MPDALAVTTSWVIPRYIIITIAITSLSIYLIGNHLALRLADVVPIKAFQFWKEDWFPGAGLMLTFTNSYRDLWINAHISVSIMAAIVSLLAHRRAYARAFRNLWVLPDAMKKAGYISLKMLLTLYLLSCSMVITLIWFLVPDFPLYLILPLVVWELMFTFIYGWGVGAIGLAGAVEPPYMREGILIFSAHYLGYKKMDIWLAPWMINPGRDAALLLNNAFRVGYWCGCKPSSYIKAMIVANVLWTISALAFTELFWKMAPIPSAAYPWAAVSWALAAVRSTYFPSIALGKMIRPVFHVDMFILGIIIGLVAILLFKLFKTPLTAFIGVVSGLTIAPPIALSLLIGLLLGLVAERFKGREWWRTYRTSIIAGIALGEGIVIALGGALMLIVKSIWISPY